MKKKPRENCPSPPVPSLNESRVNTSIDGTYALKNRGSKAKKGYPLAKSFPLLPVAVGGATLVFALALIGIASFFVKNLDYEASTASVTKSVTYTR